MKKKYLFIGVLILFFGFFIINTNSGVQNGKKNIKYIDSLNVSLKGKIVSIKKLGRGSGLILLNLINSNYQQFDGRSRVQYFLVVKNSKAEIYLKNIVEMKINDTILVENRNILVYRGNDLILFLENGIGLTPKPNLSTSTFYNNIRKAHSL